MRQIISALVLACIATATTFTRAQGTTAAATSPSRSVEQELIKLEQAWSEARLRGDIATLERMLADDFLATSFDGAVRDKARWTKEVAPPPTTATILAHDTDDLRVRAYGDAAVLTGCQTVKREG